LALLIVDKSMLKNYFIGCWGGPRKDFLNGNLFIKTHLEKLSSIKHNLDLVTIGYPQSNLETKEYSRFMNEIETQGRLKDGTIVEVLRVKNEGASYGQFSKAFEKYRRSFDRYIFTEDDYVPVIDNFDDILVDLYETKKAGYLCGLVIENVGDYGRNVIKHGAVSTGIIGIECLEKIYGIYGKIPYEAKTACRSQIKFTRAPLHSGYEICDYASEHRVLYWSHKNISVYGDPKKKDIFVPIQFLENPELYLYDLYDITGKYKTYEYNYLRFPSHL
jgi:hypothetical protein